MFIWEKLEFIMTVFEQGYVICPTSTFIYILSLGYKDTAANDIVM